MGGFCSPFPSIDLMDPLLTDTMTEPEYIIPLEASLQLDAYPAFHAAAAHEMGNSLTLAVSTQFYLTRVTVDFAAALSAAITAGIAQSTSQGFASSASFGVTAAYTNVYSLVIDRALTLSTTAGFSIAIQFSIEAALSLGVSPAIAMAAQTDLVAALSLSTSTSASFAAIATFVSTLALSVHPSIAQSVTQQITAALALAITGGLDASAVGTFLSNLELNARQAAAFDTGVDYYRTLSLETIAAFATSFRIQGQMPAFNEGTTRDVRPVHTTTQNFVTGRGAAFELEYGMTMPAIPQQMMSPLPPQSMTEPDGDLEQ